MNLLLFLLIVGGALGLPTTDTKVFLKAGLLFESVNPSPTLVNPDRMVFHREVPYAPLDYVVKLIKAYKVSADLVCKEILSPTDNPFAYKYFVTPQQTTLMNAETLCRRHYGRLPEIRTESQMEALAKMARQYNLKLVPAGITFDSTSLTFRYHSDNADISPNNILNSVIISDDLSHTKTFAIKDEAIVHRANTNWLVYSNMDTKTTLRLVSLEAIKRNDYILCEKPTRNKAAKSPYMEMLTQECLQDIPVITNFTSQVINEIQSLLGITTPFTHPVHNTNETRGKRDIEQQIQQHFH